MVRVNRHLIAGLLSVLLLFSQWAVAEHWSELMASGHDHDLQCQMCTFDHLPLIDAFSQQYPLSERQTEAIRDYQAAFLQQNCSGGSIRAPPFPAR